jgi:predicted nucleic acid-binding protein
MRVVVSDSGPLICLGRLDPLRLLPALFDEVQVPGQVLRECAARPQSPDTIRIAAAVSERWLLPCDAELLPSDQLGRGERAAISRALAIGAGVLSDDQAARTHAAKRGLAVQGTLGILVRAKRAALLPAIAPLIDQLRAGGQRFGQVVVAQALVAGGEPPS